MKKFLVVLLSLGLIAAFGMTAQAADVKVSGEYYVVGIYDNNPTLQENSFSQSYAWQRVRLQPVFQIADGLKFTIRLDLQEKMMGDTSWGVGGQDTRGGRSSVGAAASAAQENIEIDQTYVTWNTRMGEFQVGYQNAEYFGPTWGDTTTTRPRIQFVSPQGPFIFLFAYEKAKEATLTNRGLVDADNDTYAVGAIYMKKQIEAGLLYLYLPYNAGRPAGGSTKLQVLIPYAKATFGPVYVESELLYVFGKVNKSELPGVADIDANSWAGYINANMKFGPAKVGAFLSYADGNDFGDKMKGLAKPGHIWNPTLILMNDELRAWGGGSTWNPRPYAMGGGNGADTYKTNSIIYSVYGSYAVTPKLNLDAALTYATVQTKKLTAATEATSDKLGTEFDVKATYKIYDNLSYMVGAGYLWTGDYFKDALGVTKVENDYVLMNKLTLNF